MTESSEPIFFNSDCLSAFLWVGKQNLLVQLYQFRIILPKQVYNEISRRPSLKQKADSFITTKNVEIRSIEAGTPEEALYKKLTEYPEAGYAIIGRGEASAISLALYQHGIVGSNNLRDVRRYIELYQIPLLTSADILTEALQKGLISEKLGNGIWKDMLDHHLYLPVDTFSAYLASRGKR